MSNEERSQIVKERWHTIADKTKAIFVALARLEEEQLRWTAVQGFYEERIETARMHADMPPLVPTVDKKSNLEDTDPTALLKSLLS